MGRYLRDVVRRKRPEKWRTNRWFPLHDNTPAHGLVLDKDFWAKNIVTTLEHPPYSPDISSADFYLFPRLNSSLKGRRFCNAPDIKNPTEELKSLSKNGFQKCFQLFYIVAGRSV